LSYSYHSRGNCKTMANYCFYMEYVIFYIFIFLLGLIVGSFLNCVIHRLEKEEKLNGRSYCPHCKHTLVWIDLIPVFSFLFLKGKCRYCHKKISWQYPLVELTTGLVFLLILKFQLPHFELSIFYFLISIFSFYIASSLIVIFVYDLKHYIIPDKILFPAIAITFLYQLITNYEFLVLNSLWAGLAASVFFCLIFTLSGGKWMGFGDCKIAILLGLILGFPNILVGLFLAFFFGAIIGVGLIYLNKRKLTPLEVSESWWKSRKNKLLTGLKSEVPFAPFLITGTFTALFWGNEIINWYMSLLVF